MLGNRGVHLVGLLLAPLVAASACSEGAIPSEHETEFRAALNHGPGFGKPGDTGLHDLPPLDDIECLIWDLQGGRVYSGRAETGEVIALEEPTAISAPDGSTLCSMDKRGLAHRLRLGKNGPVLFTTIGPYVFQGDLEVSLPPTMKQIEALYENIRYTFEDDRVYEGATWWGDVLLWADAEKPFSTAGRRLLVAALIDGECGGDGLPAHPEH